MTGKPIIGFDNYYWLNVFSNDNRMYLFFLIVRITLKMTRNVR